MLFTANGDTANSMLHCSRPPGDAVQFSLIGTAPSVAPDRAFFALGYMVLSMKLGELRPWPVPRPLSFPGLQERGKKLLSTAGKAVGLYSCCPFLTYHLGFDLSNPFQTHVNSDNT